MAEVMTVEIKEPLERQPFVPFTIHVADGREYNVPTPDHAHVVPSGQFAIVFTEDNREYVLPATLISGLAAALTMLG